jgi:hypothetical protein
MYIVYKLHIKRLTMKNSVLAMMFYYAEQAC